MVHGSWFMVAPSERAIKTQRSEYRFNIVHCHEQLDKMPVCDRVQYISLNCCNLPINPR
jgi:hypothetical protein